MESSDAFSEGYLDDRARDLDYFATHDLPVTASSDVNHSISYSCHGSIVYIAQLQQHLLTGLIPGLLLFGSIVKWVEETRGAGR